MCVCAQSCATLCNTMDCSLPGHSVHGIFQAREYWSGLPFPLLRGLPDAEIKPVSLATLALIGGFFATVPPWRPYYS